MSDRPIVVGDLVVVVRGHEGALGFTFRVFQFCQQVGGGWTCPRCRLRDISPEELVAATWRDTPGGFPVGWLKRISPLSELEGKCTEETKRDPIDQPGKYPQPAKGPA